MTGGSLDGRVLIVAFEGWNDAGEAASGTAKRVVEEFELEAIDEIEPDDYVDFTMARPVVRILEDGTRAVAWPSAVLYAPTRPSKRTSLADDADMSVSIGAEGELYALIGTEPSRNWVQFADDVITLARQVEIDTIVLLGSMLADTPHSRPIRTHSTSDSAAVRERLGLERSTYEGPASILSIVGLAAEDAGIETMSIWASVPHYVTSAPAPKAIIALIDALTEVVDIVVPLGELPQQSSEWERGIDELAEGDDYMRAYIDHLEEQRDTVDSPAASGEALAQEFERFLQESRPEDAADDESGEGTAGDDDAAGDDTPPGAPPV